MSEDGAADREPGRRRADPAESPLAAPQVTASASTGNDSATAAPVAATATIAELAPAAPPWTAA